MIIKYEYSSKIELGNNNILVYSELSQLSQFLPSHVIATIPNDAKCQIYNDFNTRTVFVQLEKEPEKNRRLGAKAFQTISGFKPGKIQVLGEIDAAFVEGLTLSNYVFDEYKTSERAETPVFCFDSKDQTKLEKLKTIIESVFWARNLVNQPFNFLNAISFEAQIKARFEGTSVACNFLNKEQMIKESFGGILAVNQASKVEPRFGILEYKPTNTQDTQPIVLVGKGVVYDTGGLSIKPTENSMDFMKCDMAGLATVVSTLDALVQTKSTKWVIALCPITDNLIGNQAFAPGDVITMKSGATVEVMDTDAEGRLILADALFYAQSLNPSLVIDVATLTGSAVRAIGEKAAVLMGTAPSALFHLISKLGEETGERVARFPFWDDYKEELKSDIADLKNLGGPTAGAITAGKFLEHFVAYDWLHVDIAGPAYTHKPWHYQKVGGTGFGVRLLLNLIEEIKK